ncbi:olfactory receptor 52D1 [Sigmodon hispidus]
MELGPALLSLNQTLSGPGPFVLLGVPGLKGLHAWLSVPVCLLYLASLVGNILLLGLVAIDKTLRAPMYQLLGLLAAADLILATSTVPKALAVLWGLSDEISFGGCLAQLFVAHVAFIAESSVLLAMAVDRYVAICQPLRYGALLSQRVVGIVAVASVTRGACVMAPPVVLLQRLPYCGHRALPHTYCEHMGVARLACGDTRPNIWYGLATTLLSPALDLGLIGASYALILRAVCRLPSPGARYKTLGTCGAHAGVIVLFYTPALFSFLAHRFGRHTVPSHIHILLANLYVVVPPALNPVVYGVRTKQITQRLRHLLQRVRQLVKGTLNSMDESGTFQCVVHLPNNSIFVQQLEHLQSTLQDLISKYEQQLSKAKEYTYTTEDPDSQTLELSNMLESGNPDATLFQYDNPAFNLLRLELEGAQELAAQLQAKAAVNGDMDLLHQLWNQVTNASLTLKLLADSDYRSFHALQEEVGVLEGRLSECEREKEQEQSSSDPGPPLAPGSCTHGRLQKVSKPLVLKLNWRGLSYKAGAWGRDSAPNPASSLYWEAPLRADGRYFDYYRLHESYDDLMLLKHYKQWKVGYGDGSGNTVYKNFMYFNYYGTRDIAKVDLSSNTLVLRRSLPGATYNNRFSYASVPWTTLDFAADEEGLWVLYATEESKGNLVISRLNDSTLEVEQTWYTSQYKPALSGAFMACGVLYALRSLSTRQEEIFYAYDTATSQEHHLSIMLDKMLETLHGINYCPWDHKLYVYNDGFLINYDLTFPTLKEKLPSSPIKRPPVASAPSKPIKSNKPSRPRDSVTEQGTHKSMLSSLPLEGQLP